MNAFHDRWKNWFEWGIQHVSPHGFNEMDLRLFWEWFDRLLMINDNLVFFCKTTKKGGKERKKGAKLEERKS